jgi:hypothetical protein
MELLDGKWLEKFFYFHIVPFLPDELGSDIKARPPGAEYA